MATMAVRVRHDCIGIVASTEGAYGEWLVVTPQGPRWLAGPPSWGDRVFCICGSRVCMYVGPIAPS